MKHLMIDLETLGTDSDAAILAIAAVEFSLDHPQISRNCASFYRTVDLQSCLDAGLTIGADTVYWWLEQNDYARSRLLNNRCALFDALYEFQIFAAHSNFETIWAHGASFDFPILKTAFQSVRLNTPWEYKQERDSKTLFKTMGYALPKLGGAAHDALADATHQARHLTELLRRMKI